MTSISPSPGLAALIKEVEQNPNTDLARSGLVDFLSNWEPLRYHIRSTPLFELSTVCIDADKFEDLHGHIGHIELYGHIKFIDDNNKEYYLFNQAVHDAVLVPVDLVGSSPSILLLRGSHHTRPHWLPKFCYLDVCLKDRVRDIVIAEEVVYLDFSHKVVYDKEQEYSFHRHLLAKLTYTVHSYAVVARVDCTLLRNDDDSDTSAGRDDLHDVVNTTIAAKYMSGNQYISRILLGDNLSVGVTRTSWLAVPAYSPMLKIEANLKVDGKTYNSGDSEGFVVSDDMVVPCKRNIVVGKWGLIRVWVSWRNAVHFWEEEGYLRECDFNSDVERTSLEESDKESLESQESFESDQPIDQSSFDAGMMRRKKDFVLPSVDNPNLLSAKSIDPSYSDFPLTLVEVFSIAICTHDDSSLEVYGTIKVDDRIGSHDMFVRPKRRYAFAHRQYSDHHRDILLVKNPPRCFMGDSFIMEFDLKDGRDREISKGFMEWDYYSVIDWYDRRICSVIPGKDGFAAVHYSIFFNAVQARVKAVFKIVDGDDHVCVVTGRICSRYTDYRYFTSYERKYYESILYERSKSKYGLLSGDDEIPLSKSLVCVPLDVSLIVKAEFHVVVGGVCVDKLKGQVLFKAEKPEETKIQSEPQLIKGSKYGISVSVEWG